MPPKSSTRSRKKADENVLYVVLHGLITLIDAGPKKGFIAHVLEIGKRHRYVLGDWLSEEEIPERKKKKKPQRLVLRGVDRGPAILDADRSAVAKISSLPSSMHRSVRAVIRLGRPRGIYPYVIGKLRPNGLQGTLGQLVKQPTFLSGTQVFEYIYKNEDKVFLEDNRGKRIWTPTAEAEVKTKSKLIKVIVLHIYNEPPVSMSILQGNSHNRHEFKVSAGFCKFKLDLAKPTFPVPDAQRAEIRPGMLMGEILNLHQRGSAVTAILLHARNKQKGPIAVDAGGGAGGPVCGGLHAQIV
jgi:hypothetical protein